MSTRVTLADVYGYVKTTLEADSPGIAVRFGRREATQQINQGVGQANRIVFHGGDPAGNAGSLVAPRYIAQVPRAIKDGMDLFTVYCWGYDSSGPLDELKQEIASRALFDATYRAMFLKFSGWIELVSRKWKSPERIERPFGKEIEAVFTVRQAIEDHPLHVLYGVSSTTTVESVNVTETLFTHPKGAT